MWYRVGGQRAKQHGSGYKADWPGGEAVGPAHGPAVAVRQGSPGPYFNEATGGRYVPRAVLMDLEPGTMDRAAAAARRRARDVWHGEQMSQFFFRFSR